jgi:hypothetical protein
MKWIHIRYNVFIVSILITRLINEWMCNKKQELLTIRKHLQKIWMISYKSYFGQVGVHCFASRYSSPEWCLIDKHYRRERGIILNGQSRETCHWAQDTEQSRTKQIYNTENWNYEQIRAIVVIITNNLNPEDFRISNGAHWNNTNLIEHIKNIEKSYKLN